MLLLLVSTCIFCYYYLFIEFFPEILVDVVGRPMPGGGGREDICCETGKGANTEELSNVPLPIPTLPQTLLEDPAEGQGENVS